MLQEEVKDQTVDRESCCNDYGSESCEVDLSDYQKTLRLLLSGDVE